MQKEDGTIAKEGETLEFKVIEFSKENRRVVVSHLRVYDEKAPVGKTAEGGDADKAAPQQSTTQKAVKKIKESQEKSTLGDIDALAALKMSMEASEKKTDEN